MRAGAKKKRLNICFSSGVPYFSKWLYEPACHVNEKSESHHLPGLPSVILTEGSLLSILTTNQLAHS